MKHMAAAALPANNQNLQIDIELQENENHQHTETGMIILLDPNEIEIPDVPNRLPESFDTEKFNTLRLGILEKGSNLQPVGVRKIAVNPDRYRLVFGEMRVRCCALAKVKVRAMVMAPETEAEDCLDHLRENLGREELAPYEFGKQIEHAIAVVKPKSLTELASKLGVSLATVSRANDLAQLPEIIVSAFRSPNEIRYQDVKPLKEAWKGDPDAVCLEIANIRAESERDDGGTVVSRITRAVKAQKTSAKATSDKSPDPSRPPKVMQCQGQAVGLWKVSPTGVFSIEISAPMSDRQREAVVKAMETQIARKVLMLSPVDPASGQKCADADENTGA